MDKYLDLRQYTAELEEFMQTHVTFYLEFSKNRLLT